MMKKQKKNISPLSYEDTKFKYFNEYYKVGVLDEIVKHIKRNNDCVLLIDGQEGSGKSVLAGCSAKYVDESFNVERIVFDSQALFENAEKLKAQRYKAIQYDEAVTGLFSTDFMKEEFKNLIKLFSMARKRNLVVFLVVPNIRLLPAYIVTHRSMGLLHVYKNRGVERGYAKFYSKKQLEKLFYELKQKGNNAYKYTKHDMLVRFNKPSVAHFESFVDMEEYERKKDDAINKIGNGKGNIWKPRVIKLMKYMISTGVTQVQISKTLGIKQQQVSVMLTELS